MLLRCSQFSRKQFATSAHQKLTSDGRRLVLGIESSCDDSCASLVSAPVNYFRDTFQGAKIHNSIVLKQDHAITRGIEPLKAAHFHSQNVPIAIRKCLLEGVKEGLFHDFYNPTEIDAIAVTQGPGMASSLVQGLTNAKLLSALWNKPLIYVHHMVAHALTPYLVESKVPIKMPFLVLLLSGGHTQLVQCRSSKDFSILATTIDIAIGNAFDKVATILDIPFDWSKTSPGAALESFAIQRSDHDSFALPISVPKQAVFSFSGVAATVERRLPLATTEADRRALAYDFQTAAFAQIQDKLKMAFKGSLSIAGESITDLVVSGGVASNDLLRKMIKDTLFAMKREDVQLHFPPISLCTDNAAMIAHAGLIHWDLTHDLLAPPRAKFWSVEDVKGMKR